MGGRVGGRGQHVYTCTEYVTGRGPRGAGRGAGWGAGDSMYIYLHRVSDVAGVVDYGEDRVLVPHLGSVVVRVRLVLPLKLLEE